MSEAGADLDVARDSQEGQTTGPCSGHTPACAPARRPHTFHAVLHLLQVPQGDAHEAGVQHQFVLVGWPQVWGCRIHKEDPCVPCGHLVVTNEGVSEATNHHLVAAIQQALLSHHVSALQVSPDPNLGGRGEISGLPARQRGPRWPGPTLDKAPGPLPLFPSVTQA